MQAFLILHFCSCLLRALNTQLEVTNLLVGMGSAISVATIQDGNSIRGHFHLSMFGLKSLAIPHDASAAELKHALEQGLKPKLLRAHVWRQDPTTGACGGGGFVDSEGASNARLFWLVLLLCLKMLRRLCMR